MLMAWPLTEEQEAAIKLYPLAVRADELSGEWVRVSSQESGDTIGRSGGAYYTALNGACIFVSTGSGSTGSVIAAANLTLVEEIGYVVAAGDASSHGATWTHFLQLATEAYRNCDPRSHYLFDAMINMAAEGAHRDGGGWMPILVYLQRLQNRPPAYWAGGLRDLRRLAEDFARQEHVGLAEFARANNLPEPASLSGE